MNRYYVYVYLREDRYTPYYVGKGTGKRCYVKQGRNSPPPSKDRIVKIKENLLECQSLELEKTLIRFWGRKDNGTGVLRNLTDGGDGVIGDGLGNTLTEETKSKISKSLKGHKRSAESRKKQSKTMTGKKRPREVVEKMRKTLTGRKLSPETIEKIRQKKIERDRLKKMTKSQEG